MTVRKFKKLCNLIISDEFLEFLNIITTQGGTIYITGKNIKTNSDVTCIWDTVETNAICIAHGIYKVKEGNTL